MSHKLIIDERMRNIEKQKLIELGYDLIEIRHNSNVYEEISSHADIFACKIGDKLIVEPSQFSNIKNQIKVELDIQQGQEYIADKYPNDIKYNVCTIGKKAIHNFQYTEPTIIQELKNQSYELIDTTQGYTNCSIAVIDEKSAIVTDKGLYKILQKHGIDVLYLEYEVDIKLLNGKSYSDKKGFIGGVISKIDDNIFITGDLNNIDQNNIIRNFIKSKNMNIIEFEGLDVIDYGGIIKL